MRILPHRKIIAYINYNCFQYLFVFIIAILINWLWFISLNYIKIGFENFDLIWILTIHLIRLHNQIYTINFIFTCCIIWGSYQINERFYLMKYRNLKVRLSIIIINFLSLTIIISYQLNHLLIINCNHLLMTSIIILYVTIIIYNHLLIGNL